MENLFKKYRKRLIIIGIFKSVILSLAIALFFVGLTAIVTLVTKASILITLILTLAAGFCP